ncbi:MAG: hypothetical protein AAF633_20515 [Chloroflexota bacterium]
MTGAISAAYAANMLAELKLSINQKLGKVSAQKHFTYDQMADFKRVQTLIQNKKYMAADRLLEKLVHSFG